MAITKLKALGVTANTITASQIANNTITNTQINSSAAIAASKLGTMDYANMPAGSVVQVQRGYTKVNDENVTWSCAPGNGNQYGSAIGNRTYVAARTLTFTPKFSNSILWCTGQVGWTSGNSGNTGARGAMITLDDTHAIDVSDYPEYSTASNQPSYPPATTVHGTFVLSSGSQCSIRLRPYLYVESGSITARYKGHSLTVMEIKA
tara:strand:+ start:2748 stop:3365 length:618 start_codon:yes stop_codon:yes gene_type:complete